MMPFRDISDLVATCRVGNGAMVVTPFLLFYERRPILEWQPADYEEWAASGSLPIPRHQVSQPLAAYWLEPITGDRRLDDARIQDRIEILARTPQPETHPCQTLADYTHLPILQLFHHHVAYRATARRFPAGQIAVAKIFGATFWTVLPPE